MVERGVAMATRLAAAAVKTTVQQLRAQGHTATACGVVLGSGMPEWTVAQVLAVHLRMHQAEGELFRTVLVRAGERELWEQGAKTLRMQPAALQQQITALGKTLGPPWSRDQKDAALAAWLALRQSPRS
ncbi:MAG TPA: hypothetical protein VK348_11920 [Planctomycetota bacterium]|nr:hypothetical protein [Planctomycetota bacterium]